MATDSAAHEPRRPEQGHVDVSSTAPTRSLPGRASAEARAQQQRRAATQVGIVPGMQVGRYHVDSVIGEGGMGVVFRATQRRPRRDVALKIVRAAIASDTIMRRFELEAEVLGRLQHPGVAQIYDAGIVETDVGTVAFFAMELIEGETLNRYIQRTQPGLTAKLRLLASIADAVQHAHQKGVIHRDLKPANVMVTAAGQPKILDFGVARATDADLNAVTMRTSHGELVGTIPYMSPEQASGDPARLDTRSDVYALGVIGYELLTGRLPYSLEKTAVHEAVRVIIEQPPRRLSMASRVYRGDIDTIFAKALEKNPDRRYASAGEFAADIRRYLDNEPIVARPASVMYQMSRFVRRHRVIVGSLAAVIVMLIATVIVVSLFAAGQSAARAAAQVSQHRAENALALAEQRRAVAEREAAKALAVTTFLRKDMLEAADPETAPDGEVTVRAVLDSAAETVGDRFADQPAVEAAIRQTIGRVYYSLGRIDEAERELHRAAVRYEQAEGDDAPDTIRTLGIYAEVLRVLDRYDEAEALFDEVIPAAERVFGATDPETLELLNNKALLLGDLGRVEQARELLVAVREAFIEHYGVDHPDTMIATSTLAQANLALQRWDDAAPLLERVVQWRTRELGPDHPRTLIVMNNLAFLYMNGRQQYDLALPLFEQVLDARQRVLGQSHRKTLISMENLGVLYKRMGRLDESAALLEREVELAIATLGDTASDTVYAYNNLASTYVAMQREHDAEALYRKAVAARRELYQPGHPNLMLSISNHAASLRRLERFAEAEQLLLELHAMAVEHHGEGSQRAVDAAGNLLELYVQWGRPEESARWRRALDQPSNADSGR